MQSLGHMTTDVAQLVFGGFWRRLGAMIADAVVFLPLLPLTRWLQHHYRFYDCYAIGPWVLIDIAYFVWLVSRFGGTPGKLLFGLRVVRADGSPIGFQRAMLRQAPELILWLACAVAIGIPLAAMSDADYLEFSADPHRYKALEALAPAWYEPVYFLYATWVYGEVLVLLTNKKRRALHDFLAGSVVIRTRANVA